MFLFYYYYYYSLLDCCFVISFLRLLNTHLDFIFVCLCSISVVEHFLYVQEKVSNFGMFVGEQTHATKCKADVALMDRNMKVKKEAFGTEIFDKVVMESEVLTGLKALTSSGVDKEISTAIESFKQKVAIPTNKKEMKQREITNLDQE